MAAYEIVYRGCEPGVPMSYFTGAAMTLRPGDHHRISGASARALEPLSDKVREWVAEVPGVNRCDSATTLGRRALASWRVASSIVAPYHLLLFVTDDCMYAVDLDSTNGTRVNGRDLEPKRAYEVGDGDIITLAGGFHFLIRSAAERDVDRL
jgi:pSer/pThr/pTyr-binding forkhead associated (FHA) protein